MASWLADRGQGSSVARAPDRAGALDQQMMLVKG
jgi:hypothetical protein